jgi:hypothetical protein
MEQLPNRWYSGSRATVGCFPCSGGKSGAVLERACTPGFSSTETVMTFVEGIPPAFQADFAGPLPDTPAGLPASCLQKPPLANPGSRVCSTFFDFSLTTLLQFVYERPGNISRLTRVCFSGTVEMSVLGSTDENSIRTKPNKGEHSERFVK